jgi:hypothetical protein
MTQSPFYTDEELEAYEQRLTPAEANTEAPETLFREKTPEENQAAGNVQPVKGPEAQAKGQMMGGGQPQAPLNKGSGFIYGSGDPNANLSEDLSAYATRTMERMGSLGMGIIDFGMDAVGRIPGAQGIDDAWDKYTKFSNPAIQKVREAASIVLPSIMAGQGSMRIASKVTGSGGLARGLATLGLTTAADVGVNLISDQAERDETFTTFIHKTAPWIPVVPGLINQDGESPVVRRQRNMYESAALNVVGDLIGYSFEAMKAGKRGIMHWFEARDDVAKAYKAEEALTNADAATGVRLSEIEGEKAVAQQQAAELGQQALVDPINGPNLTMQMDEAMRAVKGLDDESVELTSEYVSKGYSRLTENPVESYVGRMQTSRDIQIDDIGKGRFFDAPEGEADAFITRNMFPEGSTATLSQPPGNVARNMADTTHIKEVGGGKGSPAPILSERAYYDLAKGNNTTRDIILDIAETARKAGNFDAIVDGFRYTKQQMSEGAWKIYRDLVAPDKDIEQLKKLFLDKRDVKHMLDGRAVQYMNDVDAEGTAYALRDLTDKYIGRLSAETSARAMDTVAREATDFAEGYKAFPETADYDRVTEAIGDRLGFLMTELGLNKYIAGWALKVHDRWAPIIAKAPDKAAALQTYSKELDAALAQMTTRGQQYRDMIVTTARERPEAMDALMNAFSLTKGDVDTYEKLLKYTAEQVSPFGLLAGGEGGMNAFAQGTWSVVYNNVLSGISAVRAVGNNLAMLTLKPITAYIGTGMGYMMGTRSKKDFARLAYIHGNTWDITKKSMSSMWDTYQKAWNNGKWGNDAVWDVKTLVRDDLMDPNPTIWDTLGDMEAVWEKNGDVGKLYQYRTARFLHDLGNWRWAKYGTNGLVSADAFVTTTLAHQTARLHGFEEVWDIGFKGEDMTKLLEKSTKLAYDEMFNPAGMLTDQAAKYAGGEIALNLNDATANWITMGVNKVPAAKPLFLFPKTGMNAAKVMASYTPLALIPGSSRYSKILMAGDDIDKITKALQEHGIDFATQPNAMAIYKGLQAEYAGRVAFGTGLGVGLYGHALAGNIRGNGPQNPAERQKLRDNFNWQPKQIKIGGKWVSYAGLPPFDPVLTMLGDLAYYQRDIGSTVTEDWVGKLGYTFSMTFANQTWLAGLEPLVAILNQETGAAERLLANQARSFIPQSGSLGVVAKAIDNSQKDIYKDFLGYIKNRLPGLNTTLPQQIDIYTGKAVNDIDNPMLRALNAISPVQFSDDAEPWRQWLIDTGWDGIQRIRKDSTGNHEYTSAEREVLYKYIGEQQIWKEFDKLSKSKRYNDQLDRVRAMRVENVDSDKIDVSQLQAYKPLDDIMLVAQRAAEDRMKSDNPEMWQAIRLSLETKNLLGQGQVDEARRTADRREQIQQLTKMYR